MAGALDNSTNNVTPPPSPLWVDHSTGEVLQAYDPTLKWLLQAVARLALGALHRIRICMRHVRPDWQEVQIRSAEDRRAYYAGLMACGSVWACPVCSAKIQAWRAAELRRGIEAWAARGGRVVMVTYTVPHTVSDTLLETLSRFNEAMRMFQRGEPYKRLKAAYGIAGSVKGLEVTWGEVNGWHPHAHVIYFIEPGALDLAGLRIALFERWQSATTRAGFGELSDRAFSLQDASAVRTYVTKMGREYQWNAEHELVRSHSKQGGGERFTPFDFLRAYLSSPDDGRYLALFAEFANTFYGRKQLTWSHGFKLRLLGSEGLTDEQVADSIGESDPVLAYLTLDEWRVIRRHNLQGQVLQVAELHGWEGVTHLLGAFPRGALGTGPPPNTG